MIIGKYWKPADWVEEYTWIASLMVIFGAVGIVLLFGNGR
jgi:hypothetical protein